VLEAKGKSERKWRDHRSKKSVLWMTKQHNWSWFNRKNEKTIRQLDRASLRIGWADCTASKLYRAISKLRRKPLIEREEADYKTRIIKRMSGKSGHRFWPRGERQQGREETTNRTVGSCLLKVISQGRSRISRKVQLSERREQIKLKVFQPKV
jgi:hypothetical protein